MKFQHRFPVSICVWTYRQPLIQHKKYLLAARKERRAKIRPFQSRLAQFVSQAWMTGAHQRQNMAKMPRISRISAEMKERFSATQTSWRRDGDPFAARRGSQFGSSSAPLATASLGKPLLLAWVGGKLGARQLLSASGPDCPRTSQ